MEYNIDLSKLQLLADTVEELEHYIVYVVDNNKYTVCKGCDNIYGVYREFSNLKGTNVYIGITDLEIDIFMCGVYTVSCGYDDIELIKCISEKYDLAIDRMNNKEISDSENLYEDMEVEEVGWICGESEYRRVMFRSKNVGIYEGIWNLTYSKWEVPVFAGYCEDICKSHEVLKTYSFVKNRLYRWKKGSYIEVIGLDSEINVECVLGNIIVLREEDKWRVANLDNIKESLFSGKMDIHSVSKWGNIIVCECSLEGEYMTVYVNRRGKVFRRENNKEIEVSIQV